MTIKADPSPSLAAARDTALSPCTACHTFLPPGHLACVACGAAQAAPRHGTRGIPALADEEASKHSSANGRGIALRVMRAAATIAGGTSFAVTLAACYGTPLMPDCDQFEDKDGDGFADFFWDRRSGAHDDSCVPPAGSQEDCDDNDANIHPGAEDAAGDGVDQNCDCADGVAEQSCAIPCSSDDDCPEGMICPVGGDITDCQPAVSEGEGEGE